MPVRYITIKHSIIVCRPRELVWDYTQDFARRPGWDPVIKAADIIQHEPIRVVKLKAIGQTTMTFHYKHHERPHKSMLMAEEISSPFIVSAEGTWSYDKIGKGTLWSQTNNIALRQHALNMMMTPFYKWYLKKMTRRAMNKARISMEQASHL